MLLYRFNFSKHACELQIEYFATCELLMQSLGAGNSGKSVLLIDAALQVLPMC